jgi:hypothetical protein
VQIPVQLSRAGEANPELVMTRPNESKTILVDHGLNRRYS